MAAVACIAGLGIMGTGLSALRIPHEQAPVFKPITAVTSAEPPPVAAAKPELISAPRPVPSEATLPEAERDGPPEARPERDRRIVVIEISSCSCDPAVGQRCPPRCRTSTTIIVVSSSRPRAGLGWREENGAADLELPHPPTVYRIIVLSNGDHARIVCEVVKLILNCRV